MISRIALTAALAAMALPAIAKDASYIGSVEVIRGDAAADMARGTVFLDANRNSMLDEGETGLEGVIVTNGREVVKTGADGTYELPAYADMNLSVVKAAGYTTPVDSYMVPQFAYVHKEAGSPDLRFGGIEATGALPTAVNFPMIEDDAGTEFNCLAFGDAQPYSNLEITYVRETAGKMLATSDLSDTECLIFAGDVMGDDLSLYPRFKSIIAVGQTPQYFVGGNHDVDFDAETDADSFDTFRREWGPEYWAAEIGDVMFIGLDNVNYPCNGVDPHPFCATDRNHTYNGVVSQRQIEWLGNLLQMIPADKQIVVTAHIPFQTFTDNTAAKHQTDNFAELAALFEGRKVLALTGHTHTTENIEPGVGYDGWDANTGLATSPFHQIVTGALSGSWWAGDLNDQGVPHGTQRLGSPRGYYHLAFNGADYVDTYLTFGEEADAQLHASFNSPRFRDWADALLSYVDLYGAPSDITPPVIRADLRDPYMLTSGDLAGGTWVAVNVWNGSKSSEVMVQLNGGAPMMGALTQPGEGEAKRRGVDFADPLALLKQSTQGSYAMRSAQGGDDTASFRTWQAVEWVGKPGPMQGWMLTNNSNHLWRVDLPSELPVGTHLLTVTTKDRHGREFTANYPFEVVERLPEWNWQTKFWQ